MCLRTTKPCQSVVPQVWILPNTFRPIGSAHFVESKKVVHLTATIYQGSSGGTSRATIHDPVTGIVGGKEGGREGGRERESDSLARGFQEKNLAKCLVMAQPRRR